MEPKEFFKLSAEYQISPKASISDLLDDATLLGGVVRDSLAALATSIDTAGDNGEITDQRGFSQLLYGLSYLAQMSHNATTAAYAKVPYERS